MLLLAKVQLEVQTSYTCGKGADNVAANGTAQSSSTPFMGVAMKYPLCSVVVAAIKGLYYPAGQLEHKNQSRNRHRGVAGTPLSVRSTRRKVPRMRSWPVIESVL